MPNREIHRGLFQNKNNERTGEIDNEGHLLIKVIRTRKSINDSDKKELRDNITRYTNSQNAVKGLDFYALDEFQQQLKKRFKEYGYFYEIRRGSFIANLQLKKPPIQDVLITIIY